MDRQRTMVQINLKMKINFMVTKKSVIFGILIEALWIQATLGMEMEFSCRSWTLGLIGNLKAEIDKFNVNPKNKILNIYYLINK